MVRKLSTKELTIFFSFTTKYLELDFFISRVYWNGQLTGQSNLCQPFLIPRGSEDYWPRSTRHLQRPAKKQRSQLTILSQPLAGQTGEQSVETQGSHWPCAARRILLKPTNYIEVAMPQRYFDIGLDRVGLLMDGKDCVTDTIRLNSFLSRAQYSDKMHCSAAWYIMWVLGCGLSVTYTQLFLGRVSEKALVKYWGGSTYNLLYD